MAIFKCKMCGGTLNIDATARVAECEYCGTRQTLPKLDDDRRANMYDRANHFRRNNEFDKAMSIYEQILNEDNTDAEAYWSLVLCRYGIEYVEDPTSHRRAPTINRAQFASVLADEDYKAALQYADTMQKNLYEAEAHAIDEIQKGILAISQKEEPFDVFICYKETDANGRRTPDSVLAQELYYGLKNDGFKVFFSRITLEDKLGSAYEPYIFAALNSAKVMVVLGTRPEYFNAVWVKNEWSRYLALIRKGQEKMLIPAYKDMDPYDLPEEFSHLQAQDMSKLGFMQDLTRGIKKIVEADTPKTVVKESTVTTAAPLNTSPLIKRAFMFFEDGDFESADEYCEKVLDQDPENAQAYLGKLMLELRVRRQEDLANCAAPFDSNKNYQRAVRFADALLASELKGYVATIKDRNAKSAEEARKNTNYLLALDDCKSYDVARLQNAIKTFTSLADYKDSSDRIAWCHQKIDQIHIREESERIERERLAEEKRIADEKARAERQRLAEIKRIEAEKRAKRNKKIAAIVSPILSTAIAVIILLNSVIIPNGNYNHAVALMNDGKYEQAIAAFEVLEGYKDSDTKIDECNMVIMEKQRQDIYDEAVSLMDGGEYEQAIVAFEALDGYKDSASKIEECNAKILDGVYENALALMRKGKYSEARSLFSSLGDYKESIVKAEECNTAILDGQYVDALMLMIAGKYSEALSAFEELDGHKDSSTKLQECKTKILHEKYVNALALMNAGKYSEAIRVFQSLEGYKDSVTQIEKCNTAILDSKYNSALALMAEGKYSDAIGALNALNGYKDSKTQIEKCNTAILDGKYDNAMKLIDSGKIIEAYEALLALDGYKDSSERADAIYAYYKLKSAKVGDYITFGRYEQDNNVSNGKESITWYVLAKEGDRLFIVSQYAIDSQPYNENFRDVTWETCTLRQWLNHDFSDLAFSSVEKAMISTTTVSADKNTSYNTNPGNVTQDKVFLLSAAEANNYFRSYSTQKCKPTNYAIEKGAFVDNRSGCCLWWLRTSGVDQRHASSVYIDGTIDMRGDSVFYDNITVRPAMWIDLNH